MLLESDTHNLIFKEAETEKSSWGGGTKVLSLQPATYGTQHGWAKVLKVYF